MNTLENNATQSSIIMKVKPMKSSVFKRTCISTIPAVWNPSFDLGSALPAKLATGVRNSSKTPPSSGMHMLRMLHKLPGVWMAWRFTAAWPGRGLGGVGPLLECVHMCPCRILSSMKWLLFWLCSGTPFMWAIIVAKQGYPSHTTSSKGSMSACSPSISPGILSFTCHDGVVPVGGLSFPTDHFRRETPRMDSWSYTLCHNPGWLIYNHPGVDWISQMFNIYYTPFTYRYWGWSNFSFSTTALLGVRGSNCLWGRPSLALKLRVMQRK